ncbi:MAG: hypothetical protein V1911_00220 [Candidatus Micrarchaeota archaeon]
MFLESIGHINELGCAETFKGKVKQIFVGGKRVLIARSHSVCEIDNEIPDLKVGDIVICAWNKTIKKIE